ncbi:MAG: WD40 repeat domain-containing protein [Gemmataceae bacterium]|nr:WD40 repeat domain-containing protein [Gemmataceae bacterium]
MIAQRFTTATRHLITAMVIGAFAIPPLHGQPTKAPNADDVKALQAKFGAERDVVVKAGIAKKYLPAIMDKADELAKKSEEALAGGRLSQATEAIRQARWQLPYQPNGVPDHVARIIGNLRLRHSREIKAVAYSPDGTLLASASSDRTVKIWDLGNGHEILSYTGHTDAVRCLVWSADSSFIASAGGEKNIKIWDPKTGKDKQSIVGAGANVSALAISKDGKHLFVGQFEIPGNPPNGLFVYETQTGKLVREVRDFPNRISSINVSPDGTTLATGDENGNTRLWQYPTFVDNVNQPAYWAVQDPSGAAYQVVFNADGRTLARVGQQGVKFYNVPLPGTPFQIAAPRMKIDVLGAQRAIYSKDGKSIFVGDDKGNISFWDPDSGQILGSYKNAHAGAIHGLTFNTDGNQLASCSYGFNIRLWDFDVVLQSRDVEIHGGSVWLATFSPDATRILSASADKTAKVWERVSGEVLFTLSDHKAPVTVAQFSPDGKFIATAGGDKILRIWDAKAGKLLNTGEGHQGTITFLDFSSSSTRIVTGSADRRAKIWDADTGKEILSIDDNPSIISSVAFSPNAKQIAVGNIDQTIRLYDAATGKLQQSWQAHGVAVSGVAYSPDGTYLASCGADTVVAVWPLSTPGQNAIRLSGHSGPVSMVAFRNDSQHLVSCGADQLIKLWKIENGMGKEMQTYRGHKDWVTSVAFSKDGHHVVSASVDRRVKIWEITNKEIPLLAEHTSAVESVAVSPNGKIIATGSSDRTIKFWDRETGAEIASLPAHDIAIYALAFTPDSKRLLSSGSDFIPASNTTRANIRHWEINPPRALPLTQQQTNVFGRLLQYSPYMFVEPEGKSVYIWMPINSASESTYVEAFDIDAGTIAFTFKETTRKVNSLAFCANGKLAVTGAKDGSVLFWDLSKTDAKQDKAGVWNLFDKVGVADLAITPDGATLVATSDTGEIKVGKVAGRQVVKSFKGHEGRILTCLVSPDGKRFVTMGADNIVKVWDLDGNELRRWNMGKHHESFVISLAFTPDGRQIVTANANTTVYVLDLP